VKCLLPANVPFLPPRQMGMPPSLQTVHGVPPPAPPPQQPITDYYTPSANTAAAAAPRLADYAHGKWF